ncbi:YicC/YloC family endoribonuclease [Limoniibacter endophyticus]|nr:YicC/YloC family endoribonuclease [Limoniibacter endophyticus]
MTGFARASAAAEGGVLSWELRSVNGRSLDMRVRTPQGYEALDPQARAMIQKRLARGNIQASLSLQSDARTVATPIVNEAFLIDLAGLAQRLEQKYGLAPARADGLLALRGVLEMPDGSAVSSTAEQEEISRIAMSTLAEALSQLIEARQREGAALRTVLEAQLARIEDLTLAAENDPSRSLEAVKARLAQQVALLLEESGTRLDSDKLHAEAALLATRADIREELDRLKAHVANARDLLASGGPIGRKLDFLAQEFNREANTLCSKSNAGSITAIGLDLKAVVDQFREQLQNLE